MEVGLIPNLKINVGTIVMGWAFIHKTLKCVQYQMYTFLKAIIVFAVIANYIFYYCLIVLYYGKYNSR